MLVRALPKRGQVHDALDDPPTTTAMADSDATSRSELDHQRWELVRRLRALLDGPMTALAFVWLGLLILELTMGLNAFFEAVGYVIWGLFVLDFATGLLIAPDRFAYVRRNWLTAVSLLLPALRVVRVLRVFRLLRVARATRSISLIRLVTSLNRGMGALGATLGRRGVGYVAALTAIVVFASAAAVAQFESPAALREAGYAAEGAAGAGLSGYGEALWWTAMMMTTLGSEYWPRTVEGRLLALLLALYAFAIFGYITATIASYFVGQDRAAAAGQPSVDGRLAAELASLRAEVEALRAQLAARPRDGSETAAPRTPDPRHGADASGSASAPERR